jgi:hypothetical protein
MFDIHFIDAPLERAGDHDAVLDWMLSRLHAVRPVIPE